MSKASIHSIELGRARSSTPKIDVCTIVPILACAYSAMIGPLIYVIFPPASGLQGLLESRTEQRIFWPTMAAISVVLAARNWSRLGRDNLPPNIICLLAYLTFAGASGLWAFSPELSFIRFAQEVMVLTSIVLPAMLAARTADLMRGVFLCFAIAAILNIFFVFGNSSFLVEKLKGYPGYFTGKNLLRRICCDHLFAFTSRGTISRPPESVGYHHDHQQHFAAIMEQFQNSAWPCTSCSIPSGTYVVCRKENAHFPSDHSIVYTNLLRRIVQRIWLQHELRIIYALRRFKLLGLFPYMGIRA